MQEMFSRTAKLEGVLWNHAGFEGKECGTLQENMYLFLKLPTSVDTNLGESNLLQTKKFELKPNATIYILADQPILVFSETERGTQIRRNLFALKIVTSEGLFNAPFFLYATSDMAPAVRRSLEVKSMVGGSVGGMPCLWHWNGPFAFDFTFSNILDSLPDPTAERNYAYGRNLFRRRLCSSNNDLYIHTGRWYPMSTSESVRRGKIARVLCALTMHRLRHRSCHLQRQHSNDQDTACCTQLLMRLIVIYSFKYSIAIDWKTKKIGISNLGGASSPMYAENGGTSYTKHSST
jgi:hypothetical protein